MEVRNIYKSFDEKKVLEDISFNIESGKVTSLIGRNGSGKTTTLKILARAINADSGSVFIDGKLVETNLQLHENIVYLPDAFDYFKYTKIEDIPKYYKVIYENFDTEFFEDELNVLKINKNDSPKNLSKGNRTLLGLITVIATGAKFVLLDEVLDGIDVLNKKKVIRYIIDAQENDRGFLISSHQLNELEGISDDAQYIGLDGEMESKPDIDSKVNKYQIVCNEFLSKDKSYPFHITGEIGRVYTILTRNDIKEIEESLEGNLVQYDKLELKYEDIFILEEMEEGKDE